MKGDKQARYWIAVASRDHVQKGVAGGFMQANHGKRSPLQRVSPGDWVIYYSSKMIFGEKRPCQKFTAVGQVEAGEIYQYDMGNGFEPARRQVQFYDCQEVAIRPLLTHLRFIPNPQQWGYPFRVGFFEITRPDFLTIVTVMQPTHEGKPLLAG